MSEPTPDVITITIKKKYLYVALGLVAGIGIGLCAPLPFQGERSRPSTDNEETATDLTSPVVAVVTQNRPSRGPTDAPVTFVEFTDYECPFCREYSQHTYGEILSEYGNKLRYVVLNFPIVELHPLAPLAAEAAECAHDQEKFWPYHDLLFEKAPLLHPDSLNAFAATVGLDRPRFDSCLESGRMKDVVAKDLQDGINYGITGTPTFFINGRMFTGAGTLADFKPHIDLALEEAESNSPSR